MINSDEHTSLIPISSIPRTHPGFTVFRRWSLNYSIVAIFTSIISVILSSAESINLRIVLGTFPALTGVYFSMFFIHTSINIGFVLIAILFAYKGLITPAMRERRWFKYFLFIGFMDAVLSFMIYYSSHSSRVPPPLAAILSQSNIIFTFIFSRLLLHKHYRRMHFISIGLVFLGIILSLVPTLKRIHDGTAVTQLTDGWYWPFIYVIAFIPYALLRIALEKLQMDFVDYAREKNEHVTRISIVYLRSITSTLQTIFIVLGFATDLIPGFGTSKDIGEWWTSLVNGFKCFFNVSKAGDKCGYTALFGTLYPLIGIITLMISTFLTDHISANWVALITATTPLIIVSFWFIFPSLYQWVGGTSFDSWDIGFNVGALPLVVVGAILYHRAGTDRKNKQACEITPESRHEIFW